MLDAQQQHHGISYVVHSHGHDLMNADVIDGMASDVILAPGTLNADRVMQKLLCKRGKFARD